MKSYNESWESYTSNLCKIIDQREKEQKEFLKKLYSALQKTKNAKKKLNPDAKTKAKKRLQVQEYKKIMGCSKCGYNKNPDILHFHHINPKTKLANISRMVGKNHSMKRINDEIKKCKLLCITCHHKEHGIKDNYV
tara:strand:+ start:259 stop:666 length:408 start_codon:yes stop_codon:yes gene_type:complete